MLLRPYSPYLASPPRLARGQGSPSPGAAARRRVPREGMKNAIAPIRLAPLPVTPTLQSSVDTPADGRRDLLTVEQAAAHLQLSTSSIRAYIREGRLKAFRVAGLRKVLIPRAELLALLEPAREPVPADPPTGRQTDGPPL